METLLNWLLAPDSSRKEASEREREKLRGRVRCSLSYYPSIDDDSDGIPSVLLFLESHRHLIGLLTARRVIRTRLWVMDVWDLARTLSTKGIWTVLRGLGVFKT